MFVFNNSSIEYIKIRFPWVRLLIIQVVKYSIVGVFNVIIGLGIIYFAYNVLEINYILSNIIGYSCGLINSFIWNKKWTFRTSKTASKTVIPFLIVFFVSYVSNLLCIILCVDYWSIHPNIAQLFGIFTYSTTNFLLNKFWTF